MPWTAALHYGLASQPPKCHQMRPTRPPAPAWLPDQAYRLLREMEEGEDEDEDGSGGRANQASLEGLLGRKLHLVRQIHKLITQEDAVFSS